MLQLLTPTGARPEAFALCVRWMQRQTYAGPVRWIVVDDGPEAMPVPAVPGWQVEVIRRRPFWRPGQNTQAANMLAGLEAVDPSAPLLVIEDDDHYAPDWLEHCARVLEHAELVGETHARYYNVAQRRYRELPNTRHASLCATALRGDAVETLRQVCRNHARYIDMELWRQHPGSLFQGGRVTGIKGLPGRGG